MDRTVDTKFAYRHLVVYSRHLVDWVEGKSVWFVGAELAAVFVGREAFECHDFSGEDCRL